MIEFEAPSPKKSQSSEGLVGWLKENKLLVGIVAAVVMGLVAFLLLRPGGEPEASSPTGIASAPGQVANASPSPVAASPTEAVEASEAPPVVDPAEAVDPNDTGGQAPSESAAMPTAPGNETGIVMDPGASYEMSPEVQDPEPVANSFSAAYLNAEGGKEAWLERMRPTLTEYAYEMFTYTSEEHIISDSVRLINMKTYEDGDYEVPFEVVGAEGPVMEGTMLLQPDGSWLVDQIFEPGDLDW